VNRALETLKAMYYEAKRAGYAVRNPVVGVARFRDPLDAIGVITFEEPIAYLSKASLSPTLRTLYSLGDKS